MEDDGKDINNFKTNPDIILSTALASRVDLRSLLEKVLLQYYEHICIDPQVKVG
jgi:hypothetical protein